MNIFNPNNELGDSGGVLVLGDGNMTFSLALAKRCRETDILATVLEEREEWLAKYHENCQLLSQIQNDCENPNIIALFGVDATNSELLKERFGPTQCTDIIFNFPHHGGKTNLRKSRIFLRQLFRSLSSLMRDSRFCRLHITLAKGQSGLDEAPIEQQTQFDLHVPKHCKDSWVPLEIGAEFGLIAKNVKFFNASIFHGYLPSGYKNGNRRFNNGVSAHIITFEMSPLNCSSEMWNRCEHLLALKFKDVNSQGRASFSQPIYHQFRPLYSYDISFVFKPACQSEDDEYMENLENNLFSLMRQIVGCFLAHIFELVDRRCFTPQGLQNRIYRINLQGTVVPLCRIRANAINDELCELVGQKLNEREENDVKIVTKPSYMMMRNTNTDKQ